MYNVTGLHTVTQMHNQASGTSLQVTQSRLENAIRELFGMGKCSIMSCFERSRVHLNTHPNPLNPPLIWNLTMFLYLHHPLFSPSLSIFFCASLNALILLILAGISTSISKNDLVMPFLSAKKTSQFYLCSTFHTQWQFKVLISIKTIDKHDKIIVKQSEEVQKYSYDHQIKHTYNNNNNSNNTK